jgi:hypothetical protein
VVIAMKLSRQYVVDELHRMGYAELADEALRALPDPIGTDQLQTWAIQHGISMDEVISRMGGSP